MGERWDIAVVGAGAAGSMAAIQAARVAPDKRILLLDGAKRPGAKILVAGGGRCNVTHHAVAEGDFNGSTPQAIRKVLRRFDVPATIEFFAELGVELKREATGKLFPTTDRARTVLDALFDEIARRGIAFDYPRRVERIERGFRLRGDWGDVEADRLIVATGGKALPRSGSDGHGFEMMRQLGLPIVEPIFPALVPLALAEGDPLRELSGIAHEVRVEVQSESGRRLADARGALLCTHRGLSGPAVLDISRHLIAHARSVLVVDWLPESDWEPSGRPAKSLAGHLPQRLAKALVARAGIADDARWEQLSRESRKSLGATLHRCELPIVGDLGFVKAEVTAGGVPLSALRLSTLESREVPGLFLCGEICDVDGRIGGFNFQWAWASGTIAGRAAAH